jgi:hypothetical protein
MSFKYEFRTKVRDTVTLAVGVVVARDEWLNGCVRYGISRTVNKDGIIPDLQWIDEGQLEVVEKPPKAKKPRLSGGPQAAKPSPMSR